MTHQDDPFASAFAQSVGEVKTEPSPPKAQNEAEKASEDQHNEQRTTSNEQKENTSQNQEANLKNEVQEQSEAIEPQEDIVEAGNEASVEPVATEEELLIEEEGDFFWVLQTVVWGTLKTLFVVAFLIFLIWVIWDPRDNVFQITDTSTTTPERPIIERPEIPAIPDKPEKPVEVPVIANGDLPDIPSALRAAQWHEWLRVQQQKSTDELLSQAIDWMKQSRSFFDIPLRSHLDGETKAMRVQKVDTVLSHIDFLIGESTNVRAQLAENIRHHNQVLAQDKTQLATLKNNFISSVRGFEGEIAQDILEKQADIQARMAQLDLEKNAWQALLQSIENSDRSLRSVHINITANRRAIEENIQVVGFPSDPLDRILTPAQWRATQVPTE